MEKKNNILSKIIFISIFLLIFFFFDLYTKEQFFTASLIFEKKLQSNEDENAIIFFKLFSNFGNETIFIIILLIVFLNYPLNKSYTLCNVSASMCVLSSILKNLYGDPRPFWVDITLNKTCDLNYGNPSRHTLESSAFYLSLIDILTDNQYFEENYMLKYIIEFFNILFILTITFSRVFLGTHSIDQVVYGCLLGFFVYFIFFHIIKMNKLNSYKFFGLFLNKYTKIILFTIKFISLTILYLVYFLVKNDSTKYEKNLKLICPKSFEYLKYKNGGLINGSFIYFLFGAYIGIIVMLNLTVHNDETDHDYEEYFENHSERLEAINSWNQINFIHKIYFVFIILLFSVPFLMFYIISNEASLMIIFVFKFSIPYFLVGFGTFGMTIYISYNLKIANEDPDENSYYDSKINDISFRKIKYADHV